MKKLMIGMACCAFIAPLAFGDGLQMGFITTERGITVKATRPAMAVEGGEVAGYQPAGMLVVNSQGPGRYVLDGPGHVFNSRGEPVNGRVAPGTRVHVYFASNGGVKMIDRVVLE